MCRCRPSRPAPRPAPTLQAGTACSNDLPQTGGALTKDLNGGSVPQEQPVTKGDISWGRAYGNNVAGFFANQQNAYLSAGVDRVYGPLVVIRTRAPRFPNTQKGIYPSSRDQVRYWSGTARASHALNERTTAALLRHRSCA